MQVKERYTEDLRLHPKTTCVSVYSIKNNRQRRATS